MLFVLDFWFLQILPQKKLEIENRKNRLLYLAWTFKIEKFISVLVVFVLRC